MDPVTAKLMSAAGGAAAGPIYVDDVFSTFLYDGNGTSQTIANGIDLSGEGGLVWIKNREISASDHIFTDTERGTNTILESNRDRAAQSTTDMITSFNSNGFSVSSNGNVNENNDSHCSWTFRKCPGFFDVLTYTGNGSNRTISHNLGSVPGSIWIKKTNSADNWAVYHRGTAETHYGRLNTDDEFFDEATFWNDTAPTSSVFSVGTAGNVNDSGDTYVAYIFAHDDQSFGDDEDEAIIKCGSYTGNGSATGVLENLGFEPQWVLIKRTDSAESWQLVDNMRGVTTGGQDRNLEPNGNNQEQGSDIIQFEPTGFRPMSTDGKTNGSSGSYIYIAIRRPMKTTDDADEVLDIKKVTGDGNSDRHIAGSSGASVTDMHLVRRVNTNGEEALIGTRLQGPFSFTTSTSDTEASNKYGGDSANPWDVMNGVVVSNDAIMNGSSNTFMHYFFARKPEIFDIVAYDGTGSATTVGHGLGVKPEFIIVKGRDEVDGFAVQVSSLGATKRIRLNTTDTALTISGYWNDTEPTASVFSVGTDGATNKSGKKYLAYLFASKAGVCKIGSYTGTGSDLDVDCGFQARFVMIKRTDVASDWWIVDSVHGINAGNDPGWNTNNNNTGTAQYDLIDSDSDGFTAAAGIAAINQSGGNYIFMAFA